MTEVSIKAANAKEASYALALASTETKNTFLQACANTLRETQDSILEANQRDLKASEGRISDALMDRLRLNPQRIEAMAKACEDMISFKDPVGEILSQWTRPNGLIIQQVRVPLGVIGMIYESRPNVTIDAASLCIKSGNAVILRGGKEALQTNLSLLKVLQTSLKISGLNADCVQMIENPDRALVVELMQDRQHIDVLIPRGSAALIQSVIDHATIPVIETGVGNCHVYVEESAILDDALAIMVNAKCSRPGVCNAAEKCLVDQTIAYEYLSQLVPLLEAQGIELRGCEKTVALFPNVSLASQEDWDTEYLDRILAIKIVENCEEAIHHIQAHTTHHSEAIITQNTDCMKRFQTEIDAAAVYVNASTRFTDGSEFGFGAEIGISTQKLHARGPIGLKELTSTKYLVTGTGQIR